jgi:hypothetical protein
VATRVALVTLAPEFPERPKRSIESVSSKYCSHARGVRTFPVAVEARGVPLCAKFVDRLQRDCSAYLKISGSQPVFEFALRPKGGYIRSGVADVVPEAPGRHEEVDYPLALHRATGNLKAEEFASSGRMRGE